MKAIKKHVGIDVNYVALLLILIANVCFYNAEEVIIYRMLTVTGMTMAFARNVRCIKLRFKASSCIVWLVLVYGFILFNGIFRLQAGDFNPLTMIVRLMEAIALYCIFGAMIRHDVWKIVSAMEWVGILAVTLILFREGVNILAGGMRIGDSLSGNSNTVGYNVGLFSLVSMWEYCVKKNKRSLFFFLLFTVLILLTGSKKALIILLFDLFLFLWYRRKNAIPWVIAVCLTVVVIYVIFKIPYFYNIIGFRVENMFRTMFGEQDRRYQSYSTEIREYMIQEGVRIFSKKPIFGGGYNYFYSMTISGFDYSHCNYVELLCTMGIFGTVIYYSRHAMTFTKLVKSKPNQQMQDLYVLTLMMITLILVLDVAAVTFTAQIVWYVPVLFADASVEWMKMEGLEKGKEKS